jgi:amino acid transporter
VNINSSKAGLGLFRATGIYVGAILGSGILVLPAIAAKEAGPASLLAWALLLVFCTPVAFSFAEMSRQQPDAGGIAHFVTRAYGRRASAVAGYLFYFAIPFGAPATAVIGGNYIAHAVGGGRATALVAAALLLAAAFASNAVGIRMSSGIQLVLVVLLGGLSNMQFQIGAASACFTAVTAFGLVAGIRLLPARTPAWYGVIVAAVVMLAVLVFSGWALVVPLGLAAGAVWAARPDRPGRPARSARAAGWRILPVGPAKTDASAGRLEAVPSAAPPPARP